MPTSRPPRAACVEDFDTVKEQATPGTAHYAEKRQSMASQTTGSAFSDSGYSSHTNPTNLSESPVLKGGEAPSLGLNKTVVRGDSKAMRSARPRSPIRRTSSRASKPHVDCDCALCKKPKLSPLETGMDTNYAPFTAPQPSPRLARTTSASQPRMPARPELYSAASMGPPPRPGSRHAPTASRPVTYHDPAYADPRYPYAQVPAYNTPVTPQAYYNIYNPTRTPLPMTPSAHPAYYQDGWANYGAPPVHAQVPAHAQAPAPAPAPAPANYDQRPPSSSRRGSMHMGQPDPVSRADYAYYGISLEPSQPSPKKASRHSSYGEGYILERSTTAPVHHGPTRAPAPEPVRRAETPKHSRKSSGREGRRAEVSVGSAETARRGVSRRRTSTLEEDNLKQERRQLMEREKLLEARERELARKEAERERENRTRQKQLIQQLEVEAAQNGSRVKEARVSNWVSRLGRKSTEKKDRR